MNQAYEDMLASTRDLHADIQRRDQFANAAVDLAYDTASLRQLRQLGISQESLTQLAGSAASYTNEELVEIEAGIAESICTEDLKSDITKGMSIAGNSMKQAAIATYTKLGAMYNALRHSKTIAKIAANISSTIKTWTDSKLKILKVLDATLPLLDKHGIDEELFSTLRAQSLDNYQTYDMRLDALEEIGRAVETAVSRGISEADYEELIKALKGAGFTVNKASGKLSTFRFDWHYPKAVLLTLKNTGLASVYAFSMRWKSMGLMSIFPAAFAGIAAFFLSSITTIFKKPISQRGWNTSNFVEAAKRIQTMLKHSVYMEHADQKLHMALERELKEIDKSDDEERELQLLENLKFLERCTSVYITQLGTLGVGVASIAKKCYNPVKGDQTTTTNYDRELGSKMWEEEEYE